MNQKIKELLDRIRQIEDEIELEMERRRAELHIDFEKKRVRFEREVLEQQRRFKMGLFKYLRRAKLRHVVTAPIIYSVLFPMLLMDLFVTVYQYICFPLYGIPRVRRKDYFVYDRAYLGYLNIIEKINCGYCSYGNGLISYIREIVGRTEQYWCPIKHARRVLHAHPYYDGFVDYGDAEIYRQELKRLRAELATLDQAEQEKKTENSANDTKEN
ncbi:conserved hypothetical protein [Tolumonas auensis DSM 9187]|uniref:Uncharacterized protein n=1 Tax=Tolumonas auensis (strain DSM 9187 / NBRC 110442 / TA 4) TaxID=595494 RepID=C4LE87_TOLAT|nr:hypothetical protein [Tolumonas auensis]ACQ92908.1 conserved hypothetical protein [Tolumonas auensis DSM 9187]